jgi:Ca2+-binding RTX toxin-like protein
MLYHRRIRRTARSVLARAIDAFWRDPVRAGGHPSGTPAPAAACEALEGRQLLTTTMYLDFGTAFTGGSLTMTAQQLRDIDGGVTDTGTDLIEEGYASNTQLTFTPIQFDFDGNGTINAADLSGLANAVLAVVSRAYQPFDINVQLAAATNLAAVQNTLNANDAGADPNDAYNFVTVVTAGGNSVGAARGLFGKAASRDLITTGNNSSDEVTITFADVVLSAVPPGGSLTNRLAYTAAHEAAHTFGLFHTLGGDMLTRGDQIRFGSDTRDSINIFTRFDLELNEFFGTQNNYETLVNDANIGARAGFAYVTGTGAHDRITITKLSSTQATVLVEAFSEAAYTNLLASDTYTIDTTGSITVDGSTNDDLIIYDATIGRNVTVRGIDDADTLQVTGGTFASATFNATSLTSGTITFPTFVVTFEETEAVVLNSTITTLTANVQAAASHGMLLEDDGTASNYLSRLRMGNLFIGDELSFTFKSPTGSFRLNALDGNDTVDLQSVDALFTTPITVDGGTGTDDLDASNMSRGVTLWGNTANDTLWGGMAADSIRGDDGNDLIRGGGGNNRLIGNSGDDSIYGGDNDDKIFGDSELGYGTGDDYLNGFGGNDTIYGDGYGGYGYGPTVSSALGDDTIYGQDGNDYIWADAYGSSYGYGNDYVEGGRGNDYLAGQQGDDTYAFDDTSLDFRDEIVIAKFANGQDTIEDPSGTDKIDFSNFGASVNINLATTGVWQNVGTGPQESIAQQIMINSGTTIERLTGSQEADTLIGNTASNTIVGGGGNDILEGQSGSDSLQGDGGDDRYVFDNTTVGRTAGGTDTINEADDLDTDTIDFSKYNVAVYVNLNTTATTLAATGLSLKLTSYRGIENLLGSAFNDELHGNDRANTIDGGAGNDTIYGGNENDSLLGGAGNDSIYGGNGDDTIRGQNDNDNMFGEAGMDVLDQGTGTGTSDPGPQP